MQTNDNRLERAYGLLFNAIMLKKEAARFKEYPELMQTINRAVVGLYRNAFWQMQALNRDLPWCTRREQALRDVELLRVKLTAIGDERDAFRQDIENLRQQVVGLKKSQGDALREIASLKNSEAYRVGMFVTWPARKVWGGIKCLRENGVKYTAKHAVGKVLRVFGSNCKW